MAKMIAVTTTARTIHEQLRVRNAEKRMSPSMLKLYRAAWYSDSAGNYSWATLDKKVTQVLGGVDDGEYLYWPKKVPPATMKRAWETLKR